MDGKANKWNGFEASLPGLFPFFFCSHAIDSNRLHCCDSIFVERLRTDGSTRSVRLLCNFVHRFGEGYVAFLRFSQPITATDLRKAVRNYLPQAVVSSRQGSAARLLIPRSQDMPVSASFNKLKLLADELKATDYTLTQSSLDQARIPYKTYKRIPYVRGA